MGKRLAKVLRKSAANLRVSSVKNSDPYDNIFWGTAIAFDEMANELETEFKPNPKWTK